MLALGWSISPPYTHTICVLFSMATSSSSEPYLLRLRTKQLLGFLFSSLCLATVWAGPLPAPLRVRALCSYRELVGDADWEMEGKGDSMGDLSRTSLSTRGFERNSFSIYLLRTDTGQTRLQRLGI